MCLVLQIRCMQSSTKLSFDRQERTWIVYLWQMHRTKTMVLLVHLAKVALVSCQHSRKPFQHLLLTPLHRLSLQKPLNLRKTCLTQKSWESLITIENSVLVSPRQICLLKQKKMNWRNIINSVKERTSNMMILLIQMIAMGFIKAATATAAKTAIMMKMKRNLEDSITKNNMNLRWKTSLLSIIMRKFRRNHLNLLGGIMLLITKYDQHSWIMKKLLHCSSIR